MKAHGTFVWNELASSDPRGARAFYGELLGWTFDEFTLPAGAYWVAKAEGQIVGGIGGLETGPPGTSSSVWICWIEVDDVDARVARAQALGAQVIESPNDVPNVGRVAVLRDPTGAVVGLMKG